VLEFTRTDTSYASNLMVTDNKGAITFATSVVASMLGYSVRDVVGKLNVTNLMEAPFGQLHTTWMKASVGPEYDGVITKFNQVP
jgi:hypothetical protein